MFPSVPHLIGFLSGFLSSPLKTMGFDSLQSRLICLGLALIFFNQVVAPNIDRWKSLQQQNAEISNAISNQDLANQQLSEWNRLLEEDTFFQFVQRRKLTGYRAHGESTLEEILRSRTPRS